jgi:cGMP-dependent protein kinase 2
MTSFDLIIVGSGPAGLAAASQAQSNGLSYALLERTDHLADTIDAYQARKYVMAEPMLIPARGEVPFQAGSRESILAAWGGHVKEKKLNVLFNAEVKSVKKDSRRFKDKTAKGDEYDAASVILGMGTQGEPASSAWRAKTFPTSATAWSIRRSIATRISSYANNQRCPI